ncbi:MAG: GNAT family N-acetyltransferase [Spirochaetes bacterium]|nr:GNAT family N-acetyltransferase [Spirochaetota bacterium]
MKIRKLTPEHNAKVLSLLKQAFPGSKYEVQLFENLHQNERLLHEWTCILRGRVVAYIAFSNAYYRAAVCGLHLALLAVAPQDQNCGIGAELLRFALRQEAVRESTVFVPDKIGFFHKFGFEHCAMPANPFDKNNEHFLSLRNSITSQFTVQYDPEFRQAK